MNKDLISALTSGLLASGIFLIVFGVGLGFIFLFLPTLPLFSLGFSKQPRLALIATFAATFLIAIAANPSAAFVFLFFLGLPTWYITDRSLRCKNPQDPQAWFPIGLILTHLTLYGCLFVALITSYYAGEPGGLPQMLSDNIRETFTDLRDKYGDTIDTLANHWAFLVFSITIWLWAMALYGCAWVTHRGLRRRNIPTPRPDMAIYVFSMPNWIFSLLGICALASLIGSLSMGFAGKSTLISLMLPYFFLGAALMHQASKNWPSPRFFLFLVYFVIFAQFWPALGVSFVGFLHHIKHLSGSGTWSKS